MSLGKVGVQDYRGGRELREGRGSELPERIERMCEGVKELTYKRNHSTASKMVT